MQKLSLTLLPSYRRGPRSLPVRVTFFSEFLPRDSSEIAQLMSLNGGRTVESLETYSRPFQATKCYDRLYLTAQQERHGKTRSLNSSKAVMAASVKGSVYRGKGIIGYPPEVVGFSLGGAEEHGALDLDGNDQEEDSIV